MSFGESGFYHSTDLCSFSGGQIKVRFGPGDRAIGGSDQRVRRNKKEHDGRRSKRFACGRVPCRRLVHCGIFSFFQATITQLTGELSSSQQLVNDLKEALQTEKSLYAEKCRVEELVTTKLNSLHEQNSAMREQEADLRLQIEKCEEEIKDLRCDVAAKEELVIVREGEKEVRWKRWYNGQEISDIYLNHTTKTKMNREIWCCINLVLHK